MISRAVRNTFIIVGAICAVLLVVASFFDLQISLALYEPSSFFAVASEIVGELPCYLLVPVCLSFIFAYLYNKKGWLTLTVSMLCAIISGIFWYMIIDMYTASMFSNFYVALFALPFNVLLVAFIKCSEQTKIKLFKFAVFALSVILLAILVNQGLKYLWGRYRFRDIYKADNLAAFTPWYYIRGINGNKSFPSGHATSATCVFVILYALKLFGANRKRRLITASIIGVYVALVALSRIIIGAHFLSDVVAGFIITFIIFMVLYCTIVRKEEKIFRRCYIE